MDCFLEKQGKNLWGNDFDVLSQSSKSSIDRFGSDQSAEDLVFGLKHQILSCH